MATVPLSPDPQYVPANFAHGSMSDLNSNIPRICGYKLPATQTPIQMFTPGYFGPQQQRPSVSSDAATWPTPVPGEYPIAPPVPGNGTDSTNQGQPSLGAVLPFGSLIFWIREVPAALLGYAVRKPDSFGYGKKPGETEVTFVGGTF